MPQPNIASAAFLIADPARAAMLMALIHGQARPAGELARAAGVTAQTASTHLTKLLSGGLLLVEVEGRHRYYRLAGPQVAHALETLAALDPSGDALRRPLGREAQALQFARRCYDHLAGRLGVAVAVALVDRGFIAPVMDKRFDILPAGTDWFGGLGLNVAALRPTRRGVARQCLDWTERKHHLAGPLGVQLMRCFCDAGWLRRSDTTRTMQVTPKGRDAFRRQLGVDVF
jgi:DNA-binding transcriptional ArsR family regulator